jgi:Lrp/AsnC family transcriptional regulator
MLLQTILPSSTPAGRVQLASAEASSRGGARPVRMDRIDRMIVAELQRDATLPLVRLADRVGLSQTPCWKRIRKLEAAGVITRRVALVDPQKAGLGLTAFIAVTAVEHSPTWREAFAAAMAGLPEVLEVWRMAGEADYLLKVVARDMAAFDAFYHRLTGALELKAVSSQFAMERVAYSTAMPIPDGES